MTRGGDAADESLLATASGRVGELAIHPSCPPPFPPPNRTAYALHARLMSWFLDAPAAPFGVHCVPLAGKAAAKDVGMWFGASAGASALRCVLFSLSSPSTPNPSLHADAHHSPQLRRTIFAIRDEPPTWPGVDDGDDDMLESISDPEEEADFGVDDGESSTTSHAASTMQFMSTSNSSNSGARSEEFRGARHATPQRALRLGASQHASTKGMGRERRTNGSIRCRCRRHLGLGRARRRRKTGERARNVTVSP
ncbi:hypothetical protein C8R45DRAFT_539111 [Mycena sanguinolenta]|nr:hypothetical protein C8R45DRAFT_539111 [Mycena sanguinolenta]